MSEKFLYMLILLLLVIFVSQAFFMIMSMAVLREGNTDSSSCLPLCSDISVNFNAASSDEMIQDCKQLNTGLLTSTDARNYGIPIINTFDASINNYLDQTYSFTTIIKPLYNINIKKQTTLNGNYSEQLNEEQIKINKYFTDFSGILVSTNQDILDNMANDSTFSTTIQNFRYSLEQDNNRTPPNKDEIIKKTIGRNEYKGYKSERTNPSSTLVSIYNTFLQDISGMCDSINRKCTGYYQEEPLMNLIKDEMKNPTYYGPNSSFHKLSNYIQKSRNGTLTSSIG